MISQELLAALTESARRLLTADQIRELAGLSREDLSLCHFGLGTQIRNGLIYSDAAMMAAIRENRTSADAVSALVMEGVWAALSAEFDS